MGWRLQDLTPEIISCMSPQDQAFYEPEVHSAYKEDHQPPVKTDTPEIVEQCNFALECKHRGWRAVWHATHKRSTANRGCPDFIVGVRGQTFWIEFKRPGEDLRPYQEAFKKELAQNGIIMHVVYNASQAVQVIESSTGS